MSTGIALLWPDASQIVEKEIILDPVHWFRLRVGK
jgi:hypothetical protein